MVLMSSAIYADGIVADAPRSLGEEVVPETKVAGRETISFVMEGKDYSNRSYKTKVTLPMPIVGGVNEDAINEFIKNNFQKAITKFYEETRISSLFLTPEITVEVMLEGRNMRGVIEVSYLGGSMFNLYIDTKKLEMWATRNIN